MLASVHLADVGTRTAAGLVLRGVEATTVPGMVMGELVMGARLSPRVCHDFSPVDSD